MLALGAAIAFGLDFLFVLFKVDVPARAIPLLLYLGLTLLALHLAIGTMVPFPTRRRRR